MQIDFSSLVNLIQLSSFHLSFDDVLYFWFLFLKKFFEIDWLCRVITRRIHKHRCRFINDDVLLFLYRKSCKSNRALIQYAFNFFYLIKTFLFSRIVRLFTYAVFNVVSFYAYFKICDMCICTVIILFSFYALNRDMLVIIIFKALYCSAYLIEHWINFQFFSNYNAIVQHVIIHFKNKYFNYQRIVLLNSRKLISLK